MKQIKVSAMKIMRASDIEAAMPFELISDGVIIGEVAKQEKFAGICPGCGRVVTMARPDNKPYIFSLRR